MDDKRANTTVRRTGDPTTIYERQVKPDRTPGVPGTKMKEQQELYERFNRLQEESKSLVLGTTGEQSLPRVSYAPYVRDESGSFFIFVSRLSERTSELFDRPVASILLIEDESKTSQIFARVRITYLCDVAVIDRAYPDYDKIMSLFCERFGNVVDVLRSLPDFILFRLVPRSGRFVTGFGQAYNLCGERLERLDHIGPEQIKRS